MHRINLPSSLAGITSLPVRDDLVLYLSSFDAAPPSDTNDTQGNVAACRRQLFALSARARYLEGEWKMWPDCVGTVRRARGSPGSDRVAEGVAERRR
jgi:hypothetical protein